MHRCMRGQGGGGLGKAASGGSFWDGCYLFPAACDPIRAGMPTVLESLVVWPYQIC